VLNLLAKGSEKHCRGQLGKDLDQHAADVRETVAIALGRGIKVNLYLEDWSNGYRDNPAYVYGLMERLADAGIGHFMLPDTLGVMTPERVFEAMSDMIRRFPGQLSTSIPTTTTGWPPPTWWPPPGPGPPPCTAPSTAWASGRAMPRWPRWR
jgi:isopropylmalate/homocitrate/citramalate synthase